MTLTINIRPCGYVELLTEDGVWVGPGFGGFRTVADAAKWAAQNDYRVAT